MATATATRANVSDVSDIAKNYYLAQVSKPIYRAMFANERVMKIAELYALCVRLAHELHYWDTIYTLTIQRVYALSERIREDIFDEERHEIETDYLEENEKLCRIRAKLSELHTLFGQKMMDYSRVNNETR